jgi:hypothetical protein
MTTQVVSGSIFFSSHPKNLPGAYLEETITDGSEDILHDSTATTTGFGIKHAGATVFGGWVLAATGIRYAAIKTAENKYIPLACGVIKIAHFNPGDMKLDKSYTLKAGDEIVVWTEA